MEKDKDLHIKVFYIQGDLTVQKAGELREQLLEFLSSSSQPVLNLSRLESLDTAGLQLLLSAFREARERELPLRITGTLTPSLQENLFAAGICRTFPFDAKQLEVRFRQLAA